MSSRNQKKLLQLSIATLFLFQFLIVFTPSIASGFLSSIRFESSPNVNIRYELKINSINNKILEEPILVSKAWYGLGIDDYSDTQLLIDNLARALNQNNIDKAQAIYTKLAEDHIQELDSYQFEIQQIRIATSPAKKVSALHQSNVVKFWSSDLLAIK